MSEITEADWLEGRDNWRERYGQEQTMTFDRDNARALIADAQHGTAGYYSKSELRFLAKSLADALEAALSAVPVEGDREALRREFEYRIRTAVTYGIGRGKYDDMTSQQKEDWVQAEIANAMSTRAVAPLPVEGEVEWETAQASFGHTLYPAGTRLRRIKAVPACEWEVVPGE